MTRRRWDVRLSSGSATDAGCKRELNEDCVLDASPVFCVADGMGGHDSGERASAAVIEALRPITVAGAERCDVETVRAALADAQARVAALAAAREHGCGSTVSGAAMVAGEDGSPTWLVFNVGDSRVYRLLGTELASWTHDHSLVQQWIDAGRMSEQQARQSTMANRITRAVGAPDSPPDLSLMPATPGERLLVCSDGLHGVVDQEAILATLVMGGTPRTTAQALVGLAIDAGAPDNVSAVVVDVIGTAAPVETGAGVSGSVGDARRVRHEDRTMIVRRDSAPMPAGVTGLAGAVDDADADDDATFVVRRRGREAVSAPTGVVPSLGTRDVPGDADDDTAVVRRASRGDVDDATIPIPRLPRR